MSITQTSFLGNERRPPLVPANSPIVQRIPSILFFLGLGLTIVRPCVAGSGAFDSTGSLGVARSNHTATLLPNGKVLVAGGVDDGHSVIASTELYDPASGTWTATGSLNAERRDNTATLLPNGKVLLAGGVGNSGISTSAAELYDPANGTWTDTGSLATARHYHSATLLPNGKVLVAGGYDTDFKALAVAELYDPASGLWTATGSLVFARLLHTATLLLDGKVIVAGGNDDVFPPGAAELYDPTTGSWMATGTPGVRRHEHTATLLSNGKVLVAGGVTGRNVIGHAELYEPASGTWATTGGLAAARGGHTATLLPDGKVLIAGGANFFSTPAGAELYDPMLETWTATGSLISARHSHTATSLRNGQVLAAGGKNGGAYLASAELYTGPATPPTLLNISTRMRVLTDDKVLIAGFIITGTELKRVLIRGIGPALSWGGGNTLPDPTLELYQGSTEVATNDNWKMRPDGSSQQADIESTTIPPSNDSESAILAMLGPGAYTAILAGKNGGTGVGLVEIYDLGQGTNSKPANISTRGFVDTGSNVMIGGLIVGGGSGSGFARIIVRALGPSLPLAGALVNPTLELHDGDGALIASNDNWRSDQEAEIIATGIPPSNDLESAIARNLTPGNYAAVVRGVDDSVGIALVEVYGLN